MRSGRSFWKILGVLLAAAVVARAQTPEQLEMLRTLTPEQRQMLEEQVGAGQQSQDSSARANEGSGRDVRNRAGTVDPALLPFLDEQAREEATNSQRQVLRADDSVLVEIDFALLPLNKLSDQNAPAGANAGEVSATDQRSVGADPQMIGRSPTGRPLRVLPEEEIDRLSKLRDLIRTRNPYRLNSLGELALPGFAPIALAGLTEEQATLRLSAEPALRDLDVRLRRLPLRRMGTEALKPFGYDMFDLAPGVFMPVTEIPVPSDYIVGPGDKIEVQLYGGKNRTLNLTVARDGRISFPELGPIPVGGQTFSSVKSDIEGRVARQMIGVRASVNIGDTRSIRVFVLGEARRPGSYSISGLGTITTALYAAGGVKPIGSLRDVQLKRNGALVRRFDLYDMLIRGDTTDDAKLLPGDVVFIPPVGPTVSIDGEVRRPAIYETRGETRTADLVSLAGGLTPEADAGRVSVTRIAADGSRSVIAADLRTSGASPLLNNGDVVRVSRLGPTLHAGVVLDGQVYAPGSYAWREGMRITDILGSVDALKPNADPRYIVIRRESSKDRHVSILSADLQAALAAPDAPNNVVLMPRDRLIVLNRETSREQVLLPLIEEIRLQSTRDEPTQLVRIDGRAKLPGEYPLEPGMRVRDLVRAGGSLSDAAYGVKAELTRYKIVEGESRRIELIELDLTAALAGDESANILLHPFDTLTIKEIPDWSEQETVEILGEVRFPGRYPISRGETLRSVLTRAGGLTELAFPAGSIFTRAELREREQAQLDQLADRLRKDLSILALQSTAANQQTAGVALSVGQNLMTQLQASKATGRLVINLQQLVLANDGRQADIMMRDGDRLIVPKPRQEVTVIGEVQSPSSHLYQRNLGRDDYLAMSGGMTRKADKSRVYVVRADGRVVASGENHWFGRSGQVGIQPGDTVVVPLDTERLPSLPFWQAVTGIIYNLAISAAAVNSF